MSVDEFWEGEPYLAMAYRQAFQLKREREAVAEWRQGFYVAHAVASVLSKDAKYPDEPLFMPMTTETKQEQERIKGQNDLIKMEAFASAFNSKFKD